MERGVWPKAVDRVHFQVFLIEEASGCEDFLSPEPLAKADKWAAFLARYTSNRHIKMWKARTSYLQLKG